MTFVQIRSFVGGALAALLTVGCYQFHRVVSVNADGTGKIEEMYLLDKRLAGDMDVTAALVPKKEATEVKLPPPKAAAVAQAAALLGEGVTMVAYKKLETKTSVGYEATYEFHDISKLRQDAVLDPQPMYLTSEDAHPDSGKRFSFRGGETAELSIPLLAQPDTSNGKETAANTQAMDAKQGLALLETLAVSDLLVTIRPTGKIVETNAHFVKDGVITVTQQDHKDTMADPKYAPKFKKIREALLQGTQPADAAADWKTGGVTPFDDPKYFKEETSNPLVIHFKAKPE